jgi:thiamine pyrophosphokinase
MNVYIFLNGNPSSTAVYREHCIGTKQREDLVICANGGYERAREAGIEPDILIGDLDSLPDDAAEGVETIRFQTDKDYSDFELALREAEKRRPAWIFVYGALGGRIDHELTNILLVAGAGRPVLCIERGLELHNVVDRLQIDGKRGCLFSLLAMNGSCRVGAMEGFKYSLHDEVLCPSSRGLSNVVVSDHASMQLVRGSVVAVLIETP